MFGRIVLRSLRMSLEKVSFETVGFGYGANLTANACSLVDHD